MNDDKAELIIYRLDRQDEILGEIHAQAKITNGRVTALERWQARLEGARQARGWMPAVGLATFSAAITWLVMHL